MVGPGGHLVAREVREKPPPERGGVCEGTHHGEKHSIAAGETPTGVGRCLRGYRLQQHQGHVSAQGINPHRSGEVFASLSDRVPCSPRSTPTEVGR
jgi:hypothetical protein